ncbi:MAG: amino-acid N-acetyltransferase [Rothia sp. (in: high G+C Gram-positive bacteria)]|nr:amino-acid N-acetyltransferase [Rothia sp. (in: high G+C Gram-positive bacteria)]
MMAEQAPIRIRPATVHDVPAIEALVQPLAIEGILLAKERVTYYESIQEFLIAERESQGVNQVLGCGALHVMWRDIAEIRTLASSPDSRGMGVGHKLVQALIEQARAVAVQQIFCLTFEVDFFCRQGFRIMANQDQVDPQIYAQLLRSPDEGIAEFLDLARVKPNTLGNTRMIYDL